MARRNRITSGARQARSTEATLVSWLFLASLITLLANDVYLKYAFPGFVTGKLSDIAGILLVSLLMFAAFPRHKRLCALLIVGLFILWKSPASQPVIDWINSRSNARFGRVVDYADLFALFAIPIAWWYSDRLPKRRPRSSTKRLASIPIALLSVVAVTGTSYIGPMRDFYMRDPVVDSQVDAIDVYKTVERVARRYESSCIDCDPAGAENEFLGGDVAFYYLTDPESGEVRFFVRLEKTPRFLWSDFDYELLQQAIADLKSEFAKLSPDMEYVERLNRQR